jgi:hypothetical protein
MEYQGSVTPRSKDMCSLFQTDVWGYFSGVKRLQREANNESSAGIKIPGYCVWRHV